MQSNGGRLPSTGMRRNPVTALFAGPAAGVMGAVRQSVQSGFASLITFDMGGTSTDVCLIQDGEPELTGQSTIDGLPVRTPLFDIVSVGAGCGSIVWMDDGGMLRVGPQSAGADPGPACYGRGGDLPTITDAHIIQGTIRPDAFLGGAMSIDEQASHRVFEEIAGHFDLPLPEMADSAIRVADANIVRAIQLVSTERGRDPRDYVLVAFRRRGSPARGARGRRPRYRDDSRTTLRRCACRPPACWPPTTACSRPGPAASWSTRRPRPSFATRSGR